MPSTQRRVAILLTSHNRRELTLACLQAINTAVDGASVPIIVLADAGSGDGTSQSVSNTYPYVHVLHRSADTYWAAGMREAWIYAVEIRPKVDFFLWLNDDLILSPRSVRFLIEEYDREILHNGARVIVVGRTVDPSTGETTYGGLVRKSGISRISFRHMKDNEKYCVTMNGNCVLIPACAAEQIGILSARYRHSMGDIDYGLRASRAGYSIVQCFAPVGKQHSNVDSIYGKKSLKLNLKTLSKVFSDPKGIPLGEWLQFCYTHAGPLWPINFVKRYLTLFNLKDEALRALERQS